MVILLLDELIFVCKMVKILNNIEIKVYFPQQLLVHYSWTLEIIDGWQNELQSCIDSINEIVKYLQYLLVIFSFKW